MRDRIKRRSVGLWTSWILALTGSLGAAAVTHAGPKPPAAARQDGYDLMLQATGCWFGGLWSDAEGIPPAKFKEADDKRCYEAVRLIYGGEDKTRWEQLRAFEPGAVAALVEKVGALAAANPAEAMQRAALVGLTQAVAAAQKEAAEARRAADRVKMDLNSGLPQSKLLDDEIKADPTLQSSKAMQALYNLDAGPYTHDARALAVMLAMGRMQVASGLTKHLKVYAVAGAYALLFGLVSPPVPTDPTKPLPGGQWLSYLTEAAAAAKHPVPAGTKSLREQESLAWCGTLEGMADMLSAEDPKLSKSATPKLRLITTGVRQRLIGECKRPPAP